MKDYLISNIFICIFTIFLFTGCSSTEGDKVMFPWGTISFHTTYNARGGEFSGWIATPIDFNEDARYWLMARHPTKEKVDFLRNPGETRYKRRLLSDSERAEFIRLTTTERLRHYHSQLEVDTPEKNLYLNRCDSDSYPERSNNYLSVGFQNFPRISREDFEKYGRGKQIIDSSSEFIHICWPDVTKVNDPLTKEFIDYLFQFREKRLREAKAPLD